MYRGFFGSNDAGADRFDHGARSLAVPEPTALSAVGKIQSTNGSVAITRANAVVAPLAIGDLVYQADVIETGNNGCVGIEFIDGTTFHLCADSRIAVDQFNYDAEKSGNLARLHAAKGKFAIAAGKMLSAGRLIVDSPLAKFQSIAPTTEVSGLALMFFLFCIDKLQASSESATLWIVDEGKITDKDFEHGVFELVTKDGQHLVVDDPGQTVVLRPRGSGIVVDRIANDPAHMAELLGDYQRAYVTYAEGLQDPFLQQLIKTNSGVGSGTLFASNLNFLGGSNAVVATQSYTPPPVPSPPVTIVIPPIIPGGVTTGATFTLMLPVSNDQTAPVYIGPSNALHPNNIFLDLTTVVGEVLASVAISGLPAGETITTGSGQVYTGGGTITIPAGDFYSGLTLSNFSDMTATLTVTATVYGAGGARLTTTNLALTVDSPIVPQSDAVHWIGPNGGDWSVPGNWNTGQVPIPHQDVFLDKVGSFASSGAVDIASLEISVGVTLNITGGNFSIETSANDKPLSNAGTIVIGAGATLVVGVSGFAGMATNTGLLHVNGGALNLVNLSVDNTLGTFQVDLNSTLELKAASISNGTLINDGTVDADIGAANAINNALLISNIAGATLEVAGTGVALQIEDAVTFNNFGTLLATAGATLNLVGDSLSNTGATLQVDGGATLKLDTMTIAGGTLTDNGTIDVSVASTIAGISGTDANLNGAGAGSTVTLDAALTLDYVKLNDLTIKNGPLTILDNVEVAGPVTLLNDTVDNTAAGSTLQVDDGITLTLSNTTINGGTINDFSTTGGTIDVSVASTIAGISGTDANLNGAGAGSTVTLDAALTLDYVKLNDLTIKNGPLTILDNVEVAGPVTLLNDTVDNTAAGSTLQVDDGITLTLSNTTINGGTINDFSTTGGTIDVSVASTIAGISGTDANLNGAGAGSTVTLDAALTLDYVKLNDLTIKNGPLTILDNVEVAGPVTLLNDTVDNTAAGSTLQVDDGITLTLSNTTINGGTINDFSTTGGTIDVSVASTIAGISGTDANLNGAGAGSTVTLDAALTLDYVKLNDLTIKNGPLTILDNVEVAGPVTLLNDTVDNTAAGSTLQVDDGITLTLSNTTINGGTINDFSTTGGTIDVSVASTIAGISGTDANLNGAGAGSTVTLDAALTLDYVKLNDLTIKNGPLTILDNVEVAGPVTLLNDTVDNTAAGSTLQVDDGITLTLSNTTINGGTINDFSTTGGTIDVSVASTIAGISGTDANLNGAGAGSTVTLDAALTLDYVKLNDLTIKNGPLTILDNVEVAGPVTLLNDTVDNTAAGSTLQVDDGITLTLSNTTINGGTINDFSTTGGTIDVSVASTIAGISGTDANLNGAGAGSTVTLDAALTLDYVKLNDLTIKNGPLTILDNVEVAGPVTLLNDTVDNTAAGSTLQVDDGITLTLSNTTINGGTINDFSTTGGTIDVSVASTIAGISGTDANLNGAGAGSTVTLDAALTLDYVKLNDLTIKNGPLTILDNVEVAGPVTLLNDTVDNTAAGSTLQVDDGITLTLSNTTINGGTINDFSTTGGTIDVSVASTIAGISGTDANLNGAGAGSTVTLDAALTLDYVKLNDLTIKNGPLTILDNVEVAGPVTLLNDTVDNTAAGSTLQVDDGITLTLSNTTINGGTINDFSTTGGTIDVSVASTIAGISGTDANLNGAGAGSTVTLDAALTLDYVKLNDLTIKNGPLTILDNVEVAGPVTLLNDTVDNTAAGSTLQVDDGITLTLSNTTINGGTINDFSTTGGTIDVSVASTIAGISGTDANLNGAGAGSTVTLDAALTLDYVKLNDLTIKNGPLTILDNVEVAGPVTLLNDTVDNTAAGSTLQVDDGITLTLSNTTINGGTLTNLGTVDAANGTTSITADVANTGNIIADANIGASTTTIDITGNVTGTGGSIGLFNQATVQIDGSVSGTITGSAFSGQTVFFESPTDPTTLILDQSVQFSGLITGSSVADMVSAQDLIALRDLTFSNANMSAATSYDPIAKITTITFSNSVDSAELHFAGDYTGTSWSFASDGLLANGTVIHDLAAASGTVTIDTATALEIGSASSATVAFANNSGVNGSLVVDDAKQFTGQIVGFTGDGTLANSDTIDLKDINFAHLTTETYSENASGTGGTLVLGDGTNTANINFAGNYVMANFVLQSDGSNGTLIIDPPVQSAANGAAPDHASEKTASLDGLLGDHSFAFNFDALRDSAAFSAIASGHADHLDSAAKFEISQLQSILDAAGSHAHDLVAHADAVHTATAPLDDYHHHAVMSHHWG